MVARAQRFQQGSNSVLEFNGDCVSLSVILGVQLSTRHMPNHGQRGAFERQFTSSRHRENVHSGRRILQSDRMRNGTYRGHMHMRVSGPILGTSRVPFCPLRHRPIPGCVSRPILYWNSVNSVHSSCSQHHASISCRLALFGIGYIPSRVPE